MQKDAHKFKEQREMEKENVAKSKSIIENSK